MITNPDNIIITREECMLLAAIEGISSFFGFPADNKKINTGESVYRTIFEMNQEGLIHVTDTGLELHPYLKKIFHIMRSCNNILMIYPGTETSERTCLYLEENNAACVRECKKNISELSVSLIRKENIWDFIQNTYAFPDCSIPTELLKELSETKEEDFQFQNAAELAKRKEVNMVLDLINVKLHGVKVRLIIQEDGLYPKVFFCEKNKLEIAYYSKKQTITWIYRMIKEE